MTFSGSLLWPYLYPYPQWSEGLIEAGFDELARRWIPVLDDFDAHGVDLCYEIRPCEDLHDGHSWEFFLEKLRNHRRANLMYDPGHFVLQALTVDLASFVPGRAHDDNAHVMMRYVGGARGLLWSLQVAQGNSNGVRLRVFGETGSLARYWRLWAKTAPANRRG